MSGPPVSGHRRGLAGEEPWATALEKSRELIVPGLVLAEVDDHLRKQRRAMHRLLGDLDSGAYRYEPPTAGDLARAREIDEKFRRLDLGLVDASIAALAERLDAVRILTIDSDMVAVRFGPQYRQAFELAVPLP